MALPKANRKVPFSLFIAVFFVIAFLLAFTATSMQAMSPPQGDSRPKTGLLTCSPCNVKFSKTNVGQTKTLAVVLTNNSQATINISKLNDNAPGFNVTNLGLPMSLAAGQRKSFNVTFAPTDNGRVVQNIELISDASDSTLPIYFYGVGVIEGSLVATPWGLDFGNVQVGGSATKSEVLTNSGTASVVISKATIAGTGYKILGLNTPLTLTAGQSFTFSVSFSPMVGGYADGTLSVVSNAPNPNLGIPLTGTGTSAGQLAASPASLNFGDVVVGTSGSLAGTLTATGANVTVSSATSSSSEFAVSGLSFPFTIVSGSSAPLTVTFTPGANGTAAGTISFVSDASNSPAVMSVTGVGIAQPQHHVDLSWDASGDSDIVGYNVYRGNKSGGPFTKMNSDLDPITSYTDSTVQSGSTYYYQATAVNTSGAESSPSNQVKAVIPSP